MFVLMWTFFSKVLIARESCFVMLPMGRLRYAQFVRSYVIEIA